jgi:hypothetical protein
MIAMTKVERWALRIWIGTALAAAAATWLSGLLTMAMFFILPIPFVLLVLLAPGALLYLTPAALLYVPLRLWFGTSSRRRAAIGAGAAAIALAAGFAIPNAANRRTAERAAAMMRDDMGSEPLLAPVGSIAVLADRGLQDRQGKCWDNCQRLLFSGMATTVVQGSLEVLRRPESAPFAVVRHSVVPVERGCDHRLLFASYADDSEWTGPSPPPLLWERLDHFAAQGRCFRSDWGRDARADIYLVTNHGHDPSITGSEPYDFRLSPIDLKERRSVLRREGNRLVPLMRRTRVRFALLQVPLWIDSPSYFDNYITGGWTRAEWHERGVEYDSGMMRDFIRNDLRVPDLGQGRPGKAFDGGKDREAAAVPATR